MMKDFLPFRESMSRIQTLRCNLDDLIQNTKTVPKKIPGIIQKALQDVEDSLVVEEVEYNVTQVVWKKDVNNWRGTGLQAVIPHANSGGDELQLGFTISRYERGKRKGYSLLVHTRHLYDLLKRFDLRTEKDEGEQWAYIQRLERAFGREDLKNGKDRPRIFDNTQICMDLAEKALLKLKLLVPMHGMDRMHETFDLNE